MRFSKHRAGLCHQGNGQSKQANFVANNSGRMLCVLLSLILTYILLAKTSDTIIQTGGSGSPRTADVDGQRRNKRPYQSLTVTKHNSSYVKNDITCEEAMRKVRSGEWEDVNSGLNIVLETSTTPHFRISVHDHEFDPVGWKVMDGGNLEGEFSDYLLQIFVRQFIPSGIHSYVVDIGANVGFYTILSAMMGKNVIAFEPIPVNILRMCRSFKLNDWKGGVQPDIHIFQKAVTSEQGQEVIAHSSRNPSQPFLREPQDTDVPGIRQARTSTVTLDQFAADQGWFERSDFQIQVLKISIDGKEPFTVEGAMKLLASGKIKNLLLAGRRFARPNMKEMFQHIFQAGFELRGPNIHVNGTTALAKAYHLCLYWHFKPNIRVTRYMWFKQKRTRRTLS